MNDFLIKNCNFDIKYKRIRKLADQYEEVARFVRRSLRVLDQLEKSFEGLYGFTEEFIFLTLEETIEGLAEKGNLQETEVFDKAIVPFF